MIENENGADLSGDDFADNKEIQQMRAEIKKHEQMIADSLSMLRKEFHAQDAPRKSFGKFDMFRNLDTPRITHSLKSVYPQVTLYISIVEYSSDYSLHRVRLSGSFEYLFGYIACSADYPWTYMHRESLKEKVEDFFLRRDLDFEHSEKFSNKFQVVTEDRARLQSLLAYADLDILTAFPDMELELLNNTVLFRHSQKALSLEEVSLFCDLTKALLTIFI